MSRLVEMPNGEVIEVDDNISQAALNNISKQYSKPSNSIGVMQRTAPMTEEQSVVQRRANAREKLNDSGINQYLPGFLRPNSDTARGVNRGMLMNFGDELSGAGSALLFGVPKAIAHGDISEIGKEYRLARDTERELDRRSQDRSPIASTVGELTGAVINPVGRGRAAIDALGTAAGKVGLEKVAGALARTGERVGNAGPVATAILSGANQGALNAAGSADDLSGVPGALGQGAAVGGIAGGVLGGAVHLGARGLQTIYDATPEQASRAAYSRIAKLLDNANMTPQRAAREIAVTDARGGDAMVQDLSPGLRAKAANISRKPDIESSNALIERGEKRIDSRRARFGEQVRQNSGLENTDALERLDEITGARKAAGEEAYGEGGALDKPLQWSDDLDKFFRDSPDADRLMRNAYTTAQRFGDDIGRIETRAEPTVGTQQIDPATGKPIGPAKFDTEVTQQAIPSMRAFDYLKREYDGEIGQALKSGNRTLAAGLSNQLNRLKGIIGDANPEYKSVLATQRTLFQQQAATEMGQSFLRRINKDPRVLLRELNNLPDEAKQDARIGIIDALINTDNKADPVSFFNSISRNNNQRKVLEFAFGGKGNLGRFQRWVNRELRAMRADVLTAPGRQSETSRIGMADDEIGGASNVMLSALRGFGFGGKTGAITNAMRAIENIATGTSKATQEEIAKILLSKGDNLVEGVQAAKAYQKAREASNKRRARLMAKLGQQVFSGQAGGE